MIFPGRSRTERVAAGSEAALIFQKALNGPGSARERGALQSPFHSLPSLIVPDHGVLSFFYETDSMRWGYSPSDAGCAKVFWFEDVSALSEASFPDDLPSERRYPMLHIGMQGLPSFPDPEDCYEFGLAQEGNPYSEQNTGSKLLGWPDIIQGSMALECELIARGFFLGHGWDDITEEEIAEARDHAGRWRLLFQLDMVETEDFSLMFGDCGRIYFFLPAEDLLARRFENTWLMLQCY